MVLSVSQGKRQVRGNAVNIKDIARIAGVSTSTVSKIVNNKDDSISPETREKVLRVVKQYHYTPYAAASKGAKKWTIGVLLRSSISFDSTLDGIIQANQAAGYGTLVFNSYSNAEQELKNIAAVCQHEVDGIIWEPASAESLAHASHLEARNIPVLTIGPYGGDESLLLPYKEASYRLTQELIERGHQSIGCLITRGRRTKDFVSGFRACLFDHNMMFDDGMIFYDLDDSLIGKISSRSVTGFISSHYRMALELYHLVGSLHYRIPEDVSLVSLKNDTNEALAYPGNTEISTYTIRNADFGSYLCGKLLNTIEKQSESPRSFVQRFHLDNTRTLDAPSQLRMKKITVIGSINIDTYLSVPKLPKEGTTVSARMSSKYPGGKGVNQAVGVAKLGHRVSLIGNVGGDAGSDYIYKEMTRWGVDTAGIRRYTQAETGEAYVFVDPNGDSMISVLSGANALLSPEDIREREQLFENASYCLVQSEVPMETVAASCQAAHRHAAMTIVKPSSCDYLPDEVIAEIDILVPNENELNILCPGNGAMEDKAELLLARGAGAVVVTLGDRGCYLCTPDIRRHYPAANFKPVDKTGASDAFISALASYLLYGHSLEEAIAIAIYAAGFIITGERVIPALVDKYTLENRLRQMGVYASPEP